MKKLKSLLLAVLALGASCIPTALRAANYEIRAFASGEDPSNTGAFTYCAQRGVFPGAGTLDAAASTTLTVTAGNTGPIITDADVGEGSEIIFVDSSGVLQRRTATSKTATTIVISGGAVTVTAGTTYTYSAVDCGTGADNGWIAVAGQDSATIQVIIATLGATNMATVIECRIPGLSTTNTVVWTKTYTAVGSDSVRVLEDCYELRVGFKPGSAATDSVSAYMGMSRR